MAFYGLLRISGFCLDMANSFSILQLEVVVSWSTFFAALTTFQFSVRQFNVTLQLAVFFKIGVMETLLNPRPDLLCLKATKGYFAPVKTIVFSVEYNL